MSNLNMASKESTSEKESHTGKIDGASITTITTGSLSYEEFEGAIQQIVHYSQLIGEPWILKNVNEFDEDIQGTKYISFIHYQEILQKLVKYGKLLSVEEICSVLSKNIDELSQQEHPLLHIPFFCLHPCHTEHFMKMLSLGSFKTPLNYLICWLSFVSQIVQMPFSDNYGKLLLKLSPISNLSSNLSTGGKGDSEVPTLGNVQDWDKEIEMIRKAVAHDQVNESMIYQASKYSEKLFVETVLSYSRNLIQNGEKSKAISLYLLIDEYEKAVQLALEKNSFIEALVLAKQFIPKESPLMEEVYDRVAAYFIGIGAYSMAVKLLCSVGRELEAEEILFKNLKSKDLMIAAVYLAKRNEINAVAADKICRELVSSTEFNSMFHEYELILEKFPFLKVNENVELTSTN